MEIYNGVPYIVFKNDTTGSYCAYVRIPDDHPYIKMVSKLRWFQLGKGKRHYHYDYDAVPLNVHGGLTFAKYIKNGEKSLQRFTPGYWVGWDYAHAGDALPNISHYNFPGEHTWTKDEVEEESLKAVLQLIEAVK